MLKIILVLSILSSFAFANSCANYEQELLQNVKKDK